MNQSLDVGQVARDHASDVLRWALAFGAPPAHAEDIRQDVFLALHRNYAAGQVREPSAVQAWLFGATLRTTRDLRRSLARRPDRPDADAPEGEIEPMADGVDGERSVSLGEDWALAMELLDGLKSERRAVFLAHLVKGYTFAEIASKTGAKQKTVETRFRLAREGFDKALERKRAENRRKYKYAGIFPLAISGQVVRALGGLPGAVAQRFQRVRAALGPWLDFGAGIAAGAAVVALCLLRRTPERIEPPPACSNLAAAPLAPATPGDVLPATFAPIPSAVPAVSASAPTPAALTRDADVLCFQAAHAPIDAPRPDPREALRRLAVCDRQFPRSLQEERARFRQVLEALAKMRAGSQQ